jgi:aquaporin Z
MARKLVVEAVGTFFLVLTVGLTVLEPGAGAFAPLAIGSMLMVMVYAGGHVSGAHYNPAVTLAIFLRGKASGAEVVGYWVTQMVAGALASLLVLFLLEPASSPFVPEVGPALLAEALFTFALAFVVLNVATARGNQGNSHYGLAIGFTVLASAYAAGGISGAALNPAVATGLTLMDVLQPGSLWIFLLAELAGGAAAGLLFRALDLGDDKPTAATPAQQAGLVPQAEPGS